MHTPVRYSHIPTRLEVCNTHIMQKAEVELGCIWPGARQSAKAGNGCVFKNHRANNLGASQPQAKCDPTRDLSDAYAVAKFS